MTFEEFAKANRERCEAPDGFNHNIYDWSLSDWLVAVTGEIGEAANVAKKLNRERDNISGNTATRAELRDQFRREIGDVGVYLDLIAQSEGFTLEEAMREVFNSKSEQIGYPGRV